MPTRERDTRHATLLSRADRLPGMRPGPRGAGRVPRGRRVRLWVLRPGAAERRGRPRLSLAGGWPRRPPPQIARPGLLGRRGRREPLAAGAPGRALGSRPAHGGAGGGAGAPLPGLRGGPGPPAGRARPGAVGERGVGRPGRLLPLPVDPREGGAVLGPAVRPFARRIAARPGVHG